MTFLEKFWVTLLEIHVISPCSDTLWPSWWWCFGGFCSLLLFWAYFCFVLKVAKKIFCCSGLKLICPFLVSSSCRITVFISQF